MGEAQLDFGFGDVRFGDFANLPISNPQILNLEDGTAEAVCRYEPRVGGAIAAGYKWCRDHEMDVAMAAGEVDYTQIKMVTRL